MPTQWGEVVALRFGTERAPYVVRNPAYGRTAPGSGPGDSVQFEMPWREGRSTRSARRDERLILLAPTIQLPQVDILDARVQAKREFSRQDLASGVRLGPEGNIQCGLPVPG